MTDSSTDKSQDEKKAALEELKRLLLGDEQQSIEEIRHHVFDKKQRSEDIAEVLSDSVTTASRAPEELSSSMSTVIHSSISKLVKKNPQDFADALFPVMGPAIRKSINETLKAFTQSLNYMLEQNTSAQGLKWRLESIRTGVPFAELVLKYTLVYRVDEVFLIQPGSGLLMGYAAHPEAVTEDSDAVSAMLSAIQDFVRDSFAEDKQSGLQSVELGEHTLWVVAGPQAILACAIRGMAPPSLRSKLQETLEHIHYNFKDQLDSFDGDRNGMELIDESIADCLQEQRATGAKEEEKKAALSPPLIIILVLIFVISSFFIWRSIDYSNRLEQLKTELDTRQGVILYESKEVDDRLELKLLVDPLADAVDQLPKQYNFDEDGLVFIKTAYQSLEPEILLRRVTQLLKPPATATLSGSGNTLFITGVAPSEWIAESKILLRTVTTYSAIDTSGLTPDYSAIVDAARSQLKLPGTVAAVFDGSLLTLSGKAPATWLLWYRDQRVEIEQVKNIDDTQLTVEQDSLSGWVKEALAIPDSVSFKLVNKRLVLKGNASYGWVNSLDVLKFDSPWVNSIDSRNVIVDELREFEQLSEFISKSNIYFGKGTEAVIGVDAILIRLADKIQRWSALAVILDYDVSIDLIGHTDGLGSQRKNAILALKRASWVKDQLQNNHVLPDLLMPQASHHNSNDEVNFANRRVDFKLDIISK